MRKDKTLRQKLTPFFFLATGIPIAIFAGISLIRLHDTLRSNLDSQIAENLNKADQCLNMALDKYDTLLNDFCTDDEVLSLVESVNKEQDDLEFNSNSIRGKLSHICHRNNGLEGMTVIADGGAIIYYDRLAASSVNCGWASKVQVPEVEEGTVYQGITDPVTIGRERTYTIQIARRLVDYRDIHKEIGTVIMSINERALYEALEPGPTSSNYLYQGDTVISAPDQNDIGKKKSDLESDYYWFTSIENETSGFRICNKQSLEPFHSVLWEQAAFWILITVAAIGVMSILSYHVTRPYLREIDTVAEAMNEVEKGNIKVAVQVNENMPVEMRKISSGFNEMVSHIEELIEQVKTAVVEQKNAELSALEAQIDPHFLYNTLDTINWKAIEKGQFEISEMVGALAEILRYSVKNAVEVSSVEQELYWLHQYILLQNARVDKELQVRLDVPDVIKGCRIHKLLLQPFVENAIRHGMKQKDGKCRITITMRRVDQQIHIIIKDNGKGIPQEILDRLNAEDYGADDEYNKVHLGIRNVRKRLELYYGDKAAVYFESTAGKYTKVHLFIPAVSAGEGGRQI